jgi:hypothetical protein
MVISIVTFVSFTLVAEAARADGATDPEQLFADATALIAEERWAEAIPKLEEAQRLDPGVGTQFNLAVCYAKTGKLALAWRNFSQVEALARASGKKQREDAARAELDDLRPRIALMAVKVEDVDVMTVRVDGEPVALQDLALVALDPGEHKVEAIAARKKPFELGFAVEAGEQRDVVVPVLPPLETKTEVRTVTNETTNTRRTLGFVAGGIGLAGVAAAAVTGVMLLSAKSTADDRCKPDCVTPTGEVDSEGVDAVQRGRTLLPINAVAWGVAVVGLGVGTFLLLTSGKKPAPRAQAIVVPLADGSGAYSGLRASF